MSDDEETDDVGPLELVAMSDDEETDDVGPLELSQRLGVMPEQFQQILDATKHEPNKFQSYWEMDDEDVDIDTPEQIQSNPKKKMLWAAENNVFEIVEELLSQDGTLVNVQDGDLYTPLHRAAYNAHAEMVKLLLSRGANISATTKDGWQPLHSACRWNNTDIAAILIQHGADANACSEGGQTPLHLCASNRDCKDLLELLLFHSKTQTNIKNKQGETAAVICARSNQFAYLFQICEPCINELKPEPLGSS